VEVPSHILIESFSPPQFTRSPVPFRLTFYAEMSLNLAYEKAPRSFLRVTLSEAHSFRAAAPPKDILRPVGFAIPSLRSCSPFSLRANCSISRCHLRQYSDGMKFSSAALPLVPLIFSDQNLSFSLSLPSLRPAPACFKDMSSLRS